MRQTTRDIITNTFMNTLFNGLTFTGDILSSMYLATQYSDNIPRDPTLISHLGVVPGVMLGVLGFATFSAACAASHLKKMKEPAFIFFTSMILNRLAWSVAYAIAKNNNMAQNISGLLTGVILGGLFNYAMKRTGCLNKVCCIENNEASQGLLARV